MCNYTLSDLVDKNLVPYFSAKEMMWDCDVCGAPLIYNKALTTLKCSNAKCYGQIAAKAAAMASDLGYKGLGYSTMLKLAKTFKPNDHLDLFSKKFISKYNTNSLMISKFIQYTQVPQIIDFYKIFKYLYLSNIQEDWSKIVGTCKSIEEVLHTNFPDKYSNLEVKLMKYHILKLYKIMYLFSPIYKESNNILELMITGSINNFSSKNEFINSLNTRYHKLCYFKQVGKKKSANMCICDTIDSNGNPISSHEKFLIAKESGIPIVTSKTLIKILEVKLNDTM